MLLDEYSEKKLTRLFAIDWDNRGVVQESLLVSRSISPRLLPSLVFVSCETTSSSTHRASDTCHMENRSVHKEQDHSLLSRALASNCKSTVPFQLRLCMQQAKFRPDAQCLLHIVSALVTTRGDGGRMQLGCEVYIQEPPTARSSSPAERRLGVLEDWTVNGVKTGRKEARVSDWRHFRTLRYCLPFVAGWYPLATTQEHDEPGTAKKSRLYRIALLRAWIANMQLTSNHFSCDNHTLVLERFAPTLFNMAPLTATNLTAPLSTFNPVYIHLKDMTEP